MNLIIMKFIVFILAVLGALFVMDVNFLSYTLTPRSIEFIISDIIFLTIYFAIIIIVIRIGQKKEQEKKNRIKGSLTLLALSVFSAPLFYFPGAWFYYYNSPIRSMGDHIISFLLYFTIFSLGYFLGSLCLSLVVQLIFKLIDSKYLKV